MVRLISLSAAALVGFWHAALAREPGPACRADAVVEEMQRQVGLRDHYGRIESGLVQEQPTGTANVVRCSVCVLDVRYEATSYRTRPLRRCLATAFEVKMVDKGYVVRPLP